MFAPTRAWTPQSWSAYIGGLSERSAWHRGGRTCRKWVPSSLSGGRATTQLQVAGDMPSARKDTIQCAKSGSAALSPKNKRCGCELMLVLLTRGEHTSRSSLGRRQLSHQETPSDSMAMSCEERLLQLSKHCRKAVAMCRGNEEGSRCGQAPPPAPRRLGCCKTAPRELARCPAKVRPRTRR